MLKQLLLCKRLMSEGANLAERSDAVSSGMAISLLQDAVEMYIWTLIKDRGIPVKESSSFTANLEAVQKAGIAIPHVAKIGELNKARVGFKHYGNLPAADEAARFLAYVDDFLRTCFLEHFGTRFDDVSLTDLVSFDDVRGKLKSAEDLVGAEEYEKAASELAIAKIMLLSRLDKFVPRVERSLRDVDKLLARVPEGRGTRCFEYLAGYLEMLRETSLASLLRLPLQDYTFIRTSLSTAVQFGNGKWQTQTAARFRYDAPLCKRAIACLVDISIRMEALV